MEELSAGAELAGYRIDAVAGRGGMGIVYRATDLALDRSVALKLISTEYAEDAAFRERFKRESRLAASIRHPNVITVFRAGEEGGHLFIAMDYIDGTDLKALIAGRGRLEPRLAAQIVFQVAAALDAAHSKALVHRDVKPANVLIEGSDHAYLTDFGLTKDVSSESGMTDTGVVVGTVDYMAPEQIAGGGVDARSDIYSLGCVLWEALTGEVPYPRESAVARMFAHSSEPPPSLAAAAPELPAGLGAVIGRAMAKKREERYLSAGDLGRAAVAATEGRAIELTERSVAVGAAAHGEAPDRKVPASTGRRRLGWRWAALTMTTIAAAAAVLLLLSGGSGEPRLSKERYQDAVLDAARPWEREMARVTPSLPHDLTNPPEAQAAGAALAGLRKSTDKFIAALADINPPADVEGLHAQVVQIARRIRGDIADAGAAADFGDNRVYKAVPGRLQQDFNELEALGPRFAANGYERLSLGTETAAGSAPESGSRGQ